MASNVLGSDRKIVFETPPISRIALGRSPFSARKLSFPSAFNANLLGLSNNTNSEDGKESNQLRRRFSTVGDAVSRKLSTTIGWKNSAVSEYEVVTQGRILCGQYIKHRLQRSGLCNKKLYLTRLRSAIGFLNGATVTEVTPFLTAAGVELERMYPKLYTSISRQASMTPGGALVSDKAAPSLLVAISHELLKSDITWGKVVSVFAVAGGLAFDCVCQGHVEYIHGLMEGMTEVLEDELAYWVASNGGWPALCAQCICPEKESGLDRKRFIVVLIVSVSISVFGYLVFCLF